MINLNRFNTETIKNAALSILKKIAVRIIKFIHNLGRGQTPWVYYEDRNGKRYSTFLKKSDFSGYSWNDKLTEVINLETGDIYRVSQDYCTCADWTYRVKKAVKEFCKHQQMWSELTGNPLSKIKQYIEIKEEELPLGCFIKRSDDWMSVEYYVHVWIKEFDRRLKEFIIVSKQIGRITQYKDRINAWGNRASNGADFQNTRDAAKYLLRREGISLSDIEANYKEKFGWEEPEIENDHDLDYHEHQDRLDPFGGFEDNEEFTEELAAVDPFGGFGF